MAFDVDKLSNNTPQNKAECYDAKPSLQALPRYNLFPLALVKNRECLELLFCEELQIILSLCAGHRKHHCWIHQPP